MHLLIFLEEQDKIRTVEQIDGVISAQFLISIFIHKIEIAKGTQLPEWFKVNQVPDLIATGGHECLY